MFNGIMLLARLFNNYVYAASQKYINKVVLFPDAENYLFRFHLNQLTLFKNAASDTLSEPLKEE
jgi:hypothetical protein